MKCCNQVKKCLEGLFGTHTITRWLSSAKATLQFTFSNMESYHSRMMSLIFLPKLAKCLLALSISISLESRKGNRICNQLYTAIVFHPHMALLRPLHDVWLLLNVQSVPYINLAFCLDTHPATSSRGIGTTGHKHE